jgi:hypothetical protein
MVMAKWAEIAPLIDIVVNRIQDPEDFVVDAGSQLDGDDAGSHPCQVSRCARWCLNAGVDHLHAAKKLILDEPITLHANADYSLIRGALQNFGIRPRSTVGQPRDERNGDHADTRAGAKKGQVHHRPASSRTDPRRCRIPQGRAPLGASNRWRAIDSGLRLLAAVRRSIRKRGGEPSSRQIDELLDERLAHRG